MVQGKVRRLPAMSVLKLNEENTLPSTPLFKYGSPYFGLMSVALVINTGTPLIAFGPLASVGSLGKVPSKYPLARIVVGPLVLKLFLLRGPGPLAVFQPLSQYKAK